MNQQKENISRDELYRKVWDEPICTLAASFGVSGSYLAGITNPDAGAGILGTNKSRKETA